MGGNQSTMESISQTTNEIIQESITNSSASCNQSATMTQTNRFSGNKGSKFKGIKITANMDAILSCSQDTQQTAKMAAKLENDLKQKLESTYSGLNLSIADSKTEKLNSAIKNTTNIKNLQSAMQSAVAAVKLEQTNEFLKNIDSEFEDIDISLGGKVVSQVTQTIKQGAELDNAIKTVLDQQQKTEIKNPIADIANVIGTHLAKILGMPFEMAGKLGTFAIIGLVVVFVVFFNMGGVDVVRDLGMKGMDIAAQQANPMGAMMGGPQNSMMENPQEPMMMGGPQEPMMMGGPQEPMMM